MKKIKYIIALLTATSFATNTFAQGSNGTCGQNCSWKIENDILTVYPTNPGETVIMDAYSPVETGDEESIYKSRTSAPWGDSYQTITGVVVSAGIDTISDRAFQGLRNVTSVSMPDTLTTIGYLSFDRMTSLTSVDIPNSVTTIGRSAFQFATSLENVTIGNSVESIGQNAFSHAESLTSLNIPDSVTSIGPYAFRYATSLESINIPNGVTEISDYLFYGAQNLREVVLPDGVTSIGYASFYQTNNLESINIPSSVESIGDFAFKYAYSLTNIDFQEGLKTIGNSAFEATSLGSVELPNSVLSIGSYAFGQAYAYNDILTGRIDTIILGENIQEIGDTAFSRNTATTIVLPESLFADGRELNPYAFEYSQIKTIYCPEGNQKCLNFMPLHCTGDIDDDGRTCLGEIVPSSIQLSIKTYTKTPDGLYVLDGVKYASFSAMQKNENGRAIKRIYTVDEAEALSKPNGNKFSIRYK